ncbi:hypothetical protein L873DRAFT_1635890, partial [Choiromyces venosus 120613-1]
KPNIATAIQEFNISESHLQGTWKGNQPKSEYTLVNRNLSENKELIVCLYLRHLDEIETLAQLLIIFNCVQVNAILRANY